MAPGDAAEDPGRLILVGRVAGAFGVRGEIRITPYAAEPTALLDYRNLQREDGSPALTLTGTGTGRRRWPDRGA